MTEWQMTTLGEVLDIHDSKRVPLSSAQRAKRPGPYPYYGAQGVIDYIDDFIFDGRFILIPEDGENLRSRKLPIAYFATGQFWVNNHAHIVKAKPTLAYDRFLQSAIEAVDIGPFITGAAQPKLSQANLRRIPILLPPPTEQRLIGDVLDALDGLIENSRRRIELLEQMAQSIYREWFVHFRYPGHENAILIDSPLGPIPEGWDVTKAKDLIAAGVLDIGDGYRAKNSEMIEADHGLPFVRVADLRNGYLWLSGCDQLPLAYRERLKSKVSRTGDSVISMKGTVGRCAYVDHRYPSLVYSPQISYWRSLDFIALPPSYIHFWIRSDNFTIQCAAVKGATDMADYVNLKDQRQMVLLRPSSVVAGRFEETAGEILRTVGTLRLQIENLSAIRDRLLPRLVTGQIDLSSLDLDAEVETVA